MHKGLRSVETVSLKKVGMIFRPYIGPVLALLLISVVVGFTTDRFWAVDNWINIFRAVSVVAIMAIGAMLVILIGGIDISSGPMIALTSMVLATLVRNMGFPLWTGIVLTIVLATALGAFNGLLVVLFRMPAFVVTLATASALRGAAFLFHEGAAIFTVDPNFSPLFLGMVFGIPLPLIYVAVLYILFSYILKYTKLGREIYAVGGNEQAARLSGINVKKVKLLVFALAGMMTGVASVLMSAWTNSGSPNFAVGLEMWAIAAAVVGGASLAGGRGFIFNALFGALIIQVVRNGLNLNAAPNTVQDIALGAIIVLAVILDVWKGNLGLKIRKLFSRESEAETLEPSADKK